LEKAYVFINTEVGAESDVKKEIETNPEVRRVDLVYGLYDLVVLLEAQSQDDLKAVISEKIRKIAKVTSTLTMPVITKKF
jgi:DNA-binding Lrp family transcriptional regulator